MSNLEPRAYQQAILETAKRANTLVVLPTGIGKTLIALLLAKHRLNEKSPSKILILAPTKPLVEQHFNTFKGALPELFAELNLFTGEVPAKQRKALWEGSDIVFSTPQCIANDLKKELYNLTEVSLLVIDEAHRCLKNYDYTTVVRYYRSQAEDQRILGLTASPGTDYDIVNKICENLAIEEVEIRSRESEDVRPYVQELDFKKIEVPFPIELVEPRTLLKRIYDSLTDELKKRNLLFGPVNKITLLRLQNRLANLASSGNGSAMYGMSLCAQAIKIAHALELLETQTLAGTLTYLETLIKQAEEKKSKGVQRLVKKSEFIASYHSLKLIKEAGSEHPKIQRAIEIIEEEFETNKASKILLFTQFRETANTLVEKMKGLEDVKPSIFIGQAKKASGGMSQREQKGVIEKFKEGVINVLCATSIGEEGLDIPEVNAVLFYEPIPSAIRKIQRAGRTARHAPGKLFILITKGTKDEIHHYASSAREKKMYRTIEDVKEDMKGRTKKLSDFI